MISVILLMAGSGSRMKIQDNKVFLPLENKMIFQYSLDLFLKLNCEVICVIRPEDEDKLVIIDANEDGEISTDDARFILCWAAGIPTDELY